jgi:hypothetical protein
MVVGFEEEKTIGGGLVFERNEMKNPLSHFQFGAYYFGFLHIFRPRVM